MYSFITGSQEYGKYKTPESDVDLVIRVDSFTEDKLRRLSDDPSSPSIRFGKLNLICCTDDTEYAMWKTGTSLCRIKKVESKEKAIEVFDDIRKDLKLNYQEESGWIPR
jgi:predicted nucleotidyltransferase